MGAGGCDYTEHWAVGMLLVAKSLGTLLRIVCVCVCVCVCCGLCWGSTAVGHDSKYAWHNTRVHMSTTTLLPSNCVHLI